MSPGLIPLTTDPRPESEVLRDGGVVGADLLGADLGPALAIARTALADADAALEDQLAAFLEAKRLHGHTLDAYAAGHADYVRAVWAELRDAVTDPLAGWIIDECGYSEPVMTVLASLPATPDQLRAIADQYRYCLVWEETVHRAYRARVLTGRQALGLFRIWDDACLAHGDRAWIAAAVAELVMAAQREPSHRGGARP